MYDNGNTVYQDIKGALKLLFVTPKGINACIRKEEKLIMDVYFIMLYRNLFTEMFN